MKNFKLPYFLTILLFLFISTATTVKTQTVLSQERLFTVNDIGDSADAEPGDGFCADVNGKCTLRAAIEEANADRYVDVIIFSLPSPSVINLTLGELKITSSMFIIGPGARRLTVQRSPDQDTPDFRIFNFFRNEIYYATLRGMTIKNGKWSFGCGVYVDYDTTVYLTELDISSNTGSLGGGVGNAGTVYLTRSLLRSNSITGQGGGFINLGFTSVATISNSTITNNSSWMGGGIYNNGRLLIANNTISHNAATFEGGSVVTSLDGGATHVINTIIGSNASLSVNSLSGPFISLGNNIVTDARGSTGFTNGTNNDQVSDNNNINPLLGPLADNGGQTNTRALLPGSPAVNGGNNCVKNGNCVLPQTPNLSKLFSDQRTLHNRIVSESVDIGAFETGASAISGTASFGRLSTNPGRYQTLILTLTNSRTGEKRYSFTNPFGAYSFNNLAIDDIYVLQRRKKSFYPIDSLIIDFNEVPFSSALPDAIIPIESEGISISNFIRNKN